MTERARRFGPPGSVQIPDGEMSDAVLARAAGVSLPGLRQQGGLGVGTQKLLRRALSELAGSNYDDGITSLPGAHARPGTGSILEPVAASRIIPEESEQLVELVETGAILPPPYDQRMLVAAYEESDALPPVIEAMAVGTSGYGLQIDPTFPRAKETGEAIAPPKGADQQLDDTHLLLASLAPRVGLPAVMHACDTDRELGGNAYLEVLRNTKGKPARVNHMPAYTMRLGPVGEPIECQVAIRHPRTNNIVLLLSQERMRYYVQVRGAEVRYFKQFGDPRHLNRFTGQYRTPEQGAWGNDPRTGTSRDATEIIHMLNYNPRSSYGTPRWIGAMTHARSGRSAGELLVRWFDSAPIGAKVVLSSGGVIKTTEQELSEKIDTMIRGDENAFGVVFIEATSDPSAGSDPLTETTGQRPNLDIRDFAFVPPDGAYKGEDNMIDGARKRVRAQFRIGPVHTGESEDHSFAAAAAATAQAENAVFVPLRDRTWNPVFATLLVENGINLYKVTVRGANTTDHAEIAKGITGIVAGGGASPNQLIRLMNQLTGQQHATITEPWGDRPIALTQSLLALSADPNAPLADVVAQLREAEASKAEAAAQAAAQLQQQGPMQESVARELVIAAEAAAQAGLPVGPALVRVLRARSAEVAALTLLDLDGEDG